MPAPRPATTVTIAGIRNPSQDWPPGSRRRVRIVPPCSGVSRPTWNGSKGSGGWRSPP